MAEAAAKIDASDLDDFLADITVNFEFFQFSCQLNIIFTDLLFLDGFG